MKLIRISSTVFWCVTLLLLAPLPLVSAESPAERDARVQWFREGRFGLFIHWGIYSIPAGEWNGKTNYGEWFLEETKMPVSQYEKFAPQFNPVKFDARQWVGLAKNAGMKYIVITSKHHDGFGMFRSDSTDWCIKSTPFQRDPMKELAAACQEAGLKFCFYHSIMDWHHPDWGTRRAWNDSATGEPNMDRYVAFMKGQLKELLTGYGPIGILWFDGEWEKPWTHERGVDLDKYVRSLQPNIIVNNRVGKGRAGMAGMDQGAERVGDYGTPEQEIPATGFGPGVDWESCMTMNNHWGYNRNDQHWKSTETLVRNLIDCASKGGNYLLNVGPTSEGLIPEASVQRLQEIGQWMNGNAESIYATSASPFQRLPWGRCTKKVSDGGATLYLHVFNWPSDGKLLVPGLKNSVESARLLVGGGNLRTISNRDGVIISVPTTAPDRVSSTIVLKVRGLLDIEQTIRTQDSNGALTLPAAEAILHGRQIKYESGGNRDNIGYWLNPNDWVEWQFKVTQPGKFKVTAEIAATGRGSFIVTSHNQKLPGLAPNTGDYARFQVVELGTLELGTPGAASLAVKAVRDGWQPFNLKSIALVPLKY